MMIIIQCQNQSRYSPIILQPLNNDLLYIFRHNCMLRKTSLMSIVKKYQKNFWIDILYGMNIYEHTRCFKTNTSQVKGTLERKARMLSAFLDNGESHRGIWCRCMFTEKPQLRKI